MTIPPFNKRGVLPRGLHSCGPKEFVERFCSFHDCSATRLAYPPVLEQLFGHSIERGAKSVIFGGSFITRVTDPDDIDCIVILPNERCIPTKSEIIILSDCKLDIVYVVEENKRMVYNLMNMFARDRFDLEVGLVEVLLYDGFQSSWDDFSSELDFSELLKERESYINRHCLVGTQNRGILVTIHGINTYAEWNHEFAPIASSNNWIFAPFVYGNTKTVLLDSGKKKEILERFRIWINDIYRKYGAEPSVLAHSFGTYLFGEYISGFNFKPPVKFKDIVLTGSILSKEFDWNTSFENQSVNSVFNIVSPNDPWVPYIEAIKWIKKDPLYGTSGIEGFIQEHSRMFSEKINIYDHGNMLRVDVFENKIIPYFNAAKKFEIFNYFEYLSDKTINSYLNIATSET